MHESIPREDMTMEELEQAVAKAKQEATMADTEYRDVHGRLFHDDPSRRPSRDEMLDTIRSNWSAVGRYMALKEELERRR